MARRHRSVRCRCRYTVGMHWHDCWHVLLWRSNVVYLKRIDELQLHTAWKRYAAAVQVHKDLSICDHAREAKQVEPDIAALPLQLSSIVGQGRSGGACNGSHTQVSERKHTTS